MAAAAARKDVSVGIIGMGDMGKMYARVIAAAGWSVNACDREDKFESLKEEFAGTENIQVYANGHLVSRTSDYIMYAVEAELIDTVVAAYGPSTKLGAVVGGQTSCKAPEIKAFEKHLPSDVEIVSCHSLHGPKIHSAGQPLVIIRHRASDESFKLVEDILSCFQSKLVYLSAEEHDKITADTQAVTHAAFLSMGTAWTANNQFPWEVTRWQGGIENVKINVTLRIYSNKWHVYAGLAILNPAAQQQIRQYAASVTELFKLILEGKKEELSRRIRSAGEFVFGKQKDQELLLRDEILDKFSLSGVPPHARRPNSHLSLLAMVDCWHKCNIVPYDHIICSTPLFRLWLGATEYLFRQPDLLDECIRFAIADHSFRSDDLEFTFAARGWSDAVSFGDFDAYRKRFEKPQEYFAPRFEDATRLGNEMIRTILERTEDLEKARSSSDQ
ncbi:Prephenate dehydrogenase [Choiromyces venosus 120613-1]|uniref:Prephenate dehydrogenase [NADP(+)] n=1 Tax=Choiromyces venosus 120613-1 TaxID=1336337 RepID=A0A3N4JHW5_9PEZI|nr:Prephenate dehydrogenase [Choiromyces venosus 120613-1]